jgi:hypothetical protein
MVKGEKRKLNNKNKLEKKMKNLKNLLAAVTLMAVLMISATTANAGLLVSDFSGGGDTQSCTETNGGKTNWGILVTGFTGILVTGFTGILVTGATDTPVNCGILMSD